MTGSQMLNAFDIYWDKITNLSAAPYIESEKLLFLNNAQDEFVKERAFGRNFQPPAFDDNQKRVADLRTLLQYNTYAASVLAIYGNSVAVNIYFNDPTFQYLFKVDVRVTRTNPTITAAYIPATLISMEDVGKFRASGFNRLWFKNPVYFTSRDGLIFIIGDYYTTTMDNVALTYLRKPVLITSVIGDYNGFYLSDHMSLESNVHQEIVEIAVREAKEASQDPRYQTSLAERQINTE